MRYHHLLVCLTSVRNAPSRTLTSLPPIQSHLPILLTDLTSLSPDVVEPPKLLM